MSTSNGHRNSEAPKPDALKHLVLMFDGTGNKRFNLSNVARMFEAIDDSTPKDYVQYTQVDPGISSGESVLPVLEPDHKPLQLVKYIKGVGTGLFGHYTGLGFGYGLSANVIEGYVWLSNNYCKGDKVFVFGFSRGAFSARSLVSLLHRCGGVLKNRSIYATNEPELEEDSPVVEKAYGMYQAYVRTTTSAGVAEKDPAWHKDFENARKDFTSTASKAKLSIHRVPVKMLGVWDTVGAVGIPIPRWIPKVIDDFFYRFCRFSSKHYQFHDQALSCIVENAYHALAIDEHRKHFEPTLWNAVTKGNEEVKQVWFAGSHCNVGGGADLDDLIDPDDLWQYSYKWMQNHADKHGLRFYWTYDSPPTHSRSSEGNLLPTRRVSMRAPEDSYAAFLGGSYKWLCSWKPYHREAIETNGAKLHWSVTDRIALSADLKPDSVVAQSHWFKFRETVLHFLHGVLLLVQLLIKTKKLIKYKKLMQLLFKSKKLGESRPYHPPTLFGRYGTQFTKVAPDRVELDKLDIETSDLVKKTLWQIEIDDVETDDAKKKDAGRKLKKSEPLHRLTKIPCDCGN